MRALKNCTSSTAYLKVDDRTLYPGDFIHSEADSVDHRVWSETGCTCFLMTSTEDALF